MRLCLHMMFNLPFFIFFQSTVFILQKSIKYCLILQHKHWYKEYRKFQTQSYLKEVGRIGDGCSLDMMYSKKFSGDVKLHVSVGIFDLGFIEEFLSF